MRIKGLILLGLSLFMMSCTKHAKLVLEMPEIQKGDITIIYDKPNEMNRQFSNAIYASSFENGKIEIEFDSIEFDKDILECAMIIRSSEISKQVNIPLPLEKGKKIEVKVSNLKDFDKGGILKASYSGTKHAEDFNTFWDKIQKLIIDEVNADNSNIKDIYTKFVGVYSQYINSYPESGFPYMLMLQQISSLQYDENNPLIAYSNKICVDINKNPWKEIYCRLIGEKMLARENSKQLVFTAQDINGKTFTERDVKGSLLLVDFWASWCKPCIEEIPHLKSIYNQYKSKGFNIVGISIDQKPEDWKKFISSNPLPWLTLIGDGNIITKRYDFQYIPYNLLVDDKGNVIGRNLHGGELDKFIEDYYSK